jgi:SAM-dependent methyltransferase
VGAGNGKYSLYAACKGAAEVVSLEPEEAGSRAGSRQLYENAAARLDLVNVRLLPERLQDFDWPDRAFDVLLLHASINHLDEDATIRLSHDEQARDVYLGLFAKLARLAAPGAKLIAVDCSPHNLLARFGRNPFAPTIEWHKHQPPELWVSLLEAVGFTKPNVRWNSVNTLRGPGRLLLGNRFAAYCLASVFCLTMDRR